MHVEKQTAAHDASDGGSDRHYETRIVVVEAIVEQGGELGGEHQREVDQAVFQDASGWGYQPGSLARRLAYSLNIGDEPPT